MEYKEELPSAAQPRWTVDTAMAYLLGLRASDQAFFAERDRRLSEVAAEREKALKIKENADLAALQLAREIQTYKDEKANQLREQINSERGNYLSREEYNAAHTALIDKVESGLKPLNDYVTSQQGRDEGIGTSGKLFIGSVGVILSIGSIISLVVTLVH